MRLKKLIVTAVTTGGLAAGSLALGAGTAGAHPDRGSPSHPHQDISATSSTFRRGTSGSGSGFRPAIGTSHGSGSTDVRPIAADQLSTTTMS